MTSWRHVRWAIGNRRYLGRPGADLCELRVAPASSRPFSFPRPKAGWKPALHGKKGTMDPQRTKGVSHENDPPDSGLPAASGCMRRIQRVEAARGDEVTQRRSGQAGDHVGKGL